MNFRHMIVGLGGVAMMVLAILPARAEDDIWHRDTLTGDWGGARTALKNRGIDVSAIYIGEELGDVSGGMRRGFAYEGRAELTLEADLDKLMGWSGGLVSCYRLSAPAPARRHRRRLYRLDRRSEQHRGAPRDTAVHAVAAAEPVRRQGLGARSASSPPMTSS